MVKITFDIDFDLNEKFRKMIVNRKGFYRGAIQESINEAINLWMKNSSSSTKSKTKVKTVSSNTVINEITKNNTFVMKEPTKEKITKTRKIKFKEQDIEKNDEIQNPLKEDK